MDLNALAGGRWALDGVDYEETYKTSAYGESASALRFRLNGCIYVAVEDPNDGYRSCLGELFIEEGRMKNAFMPVIVEGRMKSGQDCDILELVDVSTGKVVVEVGTDHVDDYYPTFVASFSPNNMCHNVAMNEEEKKKANKKPPKEWYDDTIF